MLRDSKGVRNAWVVLTCLAGLAIGPLGCGSNGNDVLGLVVNGSTTQIAGTVQATELGSEWSTAQQITLPAGGAIQISGSLETTTDVDVYNLGLLERGDRITITTTQSGQLDSALGLFDDRAMVLMVNDDRDYALRQYDPYIDLVIREDVSIVYVAIAPSPYALSTGDYTLTVERRSSWSVPEPQNQVVLLDFDGETDLQIGSRTLSNVDPFDAAHIDGGYAGQTDTIIDIIEAMVAQDYADYDVTFLSTAEGDNPGGTFTRLVFGGYDPDLLGLADSVDYYNANPAEEAVVFTDTFQLFMPLNPTVQQIGAALANVASHELGHLLGLNHTTDRTELMDTTAPAQDLLVDQTFHIADLHDSIFPLGYQDPGMLLRWALGAL